MERLITIKTTDELKKLQILLSDKEFIAVDTETTGIDHDSEVIGYSVCADIDTGYYVVTAYWDKFEKKLIYLETKDYSTSFMNSLKNKNLIMQNAPFDVLMIRNNYGVDLMPFVHTDTLLLGHLLNENRSNGLKERAFELYGESATQEQKEMKESIQANGGLLTRKDYELYKADVDIIAKYGAKDAILTLKLFYNDIPILFEEKLDEFFYLETMPLLRGPTMDLKTSGLRIDPVKLQNLKGTLEAECAEAQAFIYKEIAESVKEKYPGTNKYNTFNIDSSQQLSWLLFVKLNNQFNSLTKAGKELCKELQLRTPYSYADKRYFIDVISSKKNEVWKTEHFNPKTKKIVKPKKIGNHWVYFECGKQSLQMLSKKYKWVEKLLLYKKTKKLLTTYVEGIQSRIKYGIIRPDFIQHGTTSGRYSCKNPNFQNLPRDDKRVKSCIISRPGKVFVGADYSQLEPRIFASISGDKKLIECFKNNDDFYSVIGTEVFDKFGCALNKTAENSFAKKFPELRDIAKVIALSATYGTTATKMSIGTGKPKEECEEIIRNYFKKFPGVRRFMLSTHREAKNFGIVYNLFGRPRRMPAAKDIKKLYGDVSHEELPYNVRNILNLAVNHRVQSTAASIMNRASIKFYELCQDIAQENSLWKEVRLVLQIHDELIVESPKGIAEEVAEVLKYAMEQTVELPGVFLISEPKIANNIADLK